MITGFVVIVPDCIIDYGFVIGVVFDYVIDATLC